MPGALGRLCAIEAEGGDTEINTIVGRIMSKTDNQAGDKKKDETEKWPDFMQFVLMVPMLLLSGFFFIVLPMMVATKFGFSFNEVAGTKVDVEMWGTLIAVLLGLTTMTVTAIFLFMTFRIDREVKEITKLAAGEAASRVASRVASEVITGAQDKVKEVEIKMEEVKDKVEVKANEVLAKAEEGLAKAKEVSAKAKEVSDKAKEELAKAEEELAKFKNSAEEAKKDINKFLAESTHKMTLQEKKEFIRELRQLINGETGGFWERLRGSSPLTTENHRWMRLALVAY